ncbi:unnamed protein product [Amoebophrya sp. A25]|nr:unnamed protein product [Amoebophrya sp. A25]|eukprot:GSA25T00018298001.1
MFAPPLDPNLYYPNGVPRRQAPPQGGPYSGGNSGTSSPGGNRYLSPEEIQQESMRRTASASGSSNPLLGGIPEIRLPTFNFDQLLQGLLRMLGLSHTMLRDMLIQFLLLVCGLVFLFCQEPGMAGLCLILYYTWYLYLQLTYGLASHLFNDNVDNGPSELRGSSAGDVEAASIDGNEGTTREEGAFPTVDAAGAASSSSTTVMTNPQGDLSIPLLGGDVDLERGLSNTSSNAAYAAEGFFVYQRHQQQPHLAHSHSAGSSIDEMGRTSSSRPFGLSSSSTAHLQGPNGSRGSSGTASQWSGGQSPRSIASEQELESGYASPPDEFFSGASGRASAKYSKSKANGVALDTDGVNANDEEVNDDVRITVDLEGNKILLNADNLPKAKQKIQRAGAGKGNSSKRSKNTSHQGGSSSSTSTGYVLGSGARGSSGVSHLIGSFSTSPRGDPEFDLKVEEV